VSSRRPFGNRCCCRYTFQGGGVPEDWSYFFSAADLGGCAWGSSSLTPLWSSCSLSPPCASPCSCWGSSILRFRPCPPDSSSESCFSHPLPWDCASPVVGSSLPRLAPGFCCGPSLILCKSTKLILDRPCLGNVPLLPPRPPFPPLSPVVEVVVVAVVVAV